MMAKQKKQAETVPLNDVIEPFRQRVIGMSSQKVKTYTIIGLIVSAVLITGASLLYAMNILGSWVPATIGSPAGVILFLLALGFVYRNEEKEWSLFQMRERLSFRQRIRRVFIWLAIYAVIFIPFGRYIPYGLGGAILISLVMTCIVFCRRTPTELVLAQQGLPDPRDISEEEALDEYANAPTEEETSEADNVYYDEQRGGVGGKLG
jgi:hypothetical protein